jgi:hypothetical protein
MPRKKEAPKGHDEQRSTQAPIPARRSPEAYQSPYFQVEEARKHKERLASRSNYLPLHSNDAL